ncbi:MAG: SCP2 sterol-binding domain-containing protein [Clostridia bacterium]|nr:SCP2 sterol-binding domain-containing protein [Clostridia bacterium]
MRYEEIIEFVQKNLKKTAAKKIEKHIAVEFDIYGEGEGAFYVEVNDGAITVEPYEYYDRDAKVYITADELVKLVNGEKTPEESFAEGILMIEGDIDLAQELIKLVKAPAKKTASKPAAKKTAVKKAPVKKETAKKTVNAEKSIVEDTKKKSSKVAKDIKK